MDICSLFSWLTEPLGKLVTSEMLSALLGALIGGYFTLRATTKAQKLAAITQSSVDDKLLYDTVRLLQVEISTAVSLYMDEYGNDLLKLPEGQPYINVFPVGANPFPIYDSSPASLSRLPAELTFPIVRLYMRAKGLITMIELNNQDAELAMALAREALKASAAEIATSDAPEAAQKLNDLYVSNVHRNAETQAMGSIADGMKGLTNEILGLLSAVERQIELLPKPLGRR